MKLAGSAIIKIRCRQCEKLSENFQVYLYWEDSERKWHEKSSPKDWEIDEEASFCKDPDAEVYGFCPDCLRQEFPK